MSDINDRDLSELGMSVQMVATDLTTDRHDYIFILTKNGSVYGETGQDHVLELIQKELVEKKNHKELVNPTFVMGPALLDSKMFLIMLKRFNPRYLVLSHNSGINVLTEDEESVTYANIVETYHQFKNKVSPWIILMIESRQFWQNGYAADFKTGELLSESENFSDEEIARFERHYFGDETYEEMIKVWDEYKANMGE